MATTKTGFLRFRSPTGEEIERPQEETQSLRRAGFAVQPGQTLLLRGQAGDVQRVPVERLSDIEPGAPLSLPAASTVFQDVAREKFGGVGGAALATGYGALQGAGFGLPGKALMMAGVPAESLGMLQAAQPAAQFVGEVAGMATGSGALSALGRGARGAAGAAEAAQVAAPSLARRAATEAAQFGAYSAGSEITRAGIEGREARPGEALVEGGVLGALTGAVAPTLARGFQRAKGLVSRAKDIKVADTAKAAETLAKQETARKVDEAIIATGDEAKARLDAYRAGVQKDIEATYSRLDDAVTAANETEQTLGQMGLPTKVGRAEATLRDRMNKLRGEMEAIEVTKAGAENEKAVIDRLGKAKVNAIDFAKGVEEAKATVNANIARAAEDLRVAELAGRDEATLARLRSSLRAEETSLGSLVAIENAGVEQIQATLAMTDALKGSQAVAKAIDMLDAKAESALLKQEAIDSQLSRIIPTEMRLPGESLAAAEGVVDSIAKRMGLAPEIERIVPQFTKQITAKRVGFMQAGTVADVLKSASRMGPEKFLEVIERLPTAEGILVGGKKAAATADSIFKWLAKNDAAVAALEPYQRTALRDILEGASYQGGGKARKAVLENMPILRSAQKATPLRIAESEVAAAMEREAGRQMTPEAFYSAKDMARINQLQADRAIQETIVSNVTNVSRALDTELAALQTTAKELGTELESANASLRTAKDAKAQRAAETRIDSLNKRIEQVAKTQESIRTKQQALGDLKSAKPLPGDTPRLRAEAMTKVADAQVALQSAKIDSRIAKLGAEQQTAASELEVLTERYNQIVEQGGFRDRMNEAASLVNELRVKYGPGAAKIERDKITNQFFAPGQQQIVERAMEGYMKTPEGKKIAEEMAAAAKAAQRSEARSIGEQVRTGSVKEQVVDGMKDPAVIAATAMGGVGTGAAVLAAMVASRAGSGGVRKVISAMSPMWTFGMLENAAKAGQAMLSNPALGATAAVAGQRLGQVSRSDVKAARTAVDDLIKEQADAKRSFEAAASSTNFPGDRFGEIEQRYLATVGELQRLRQMSQGDGTPSAADESFVNAWRVVTNPAVLVEAFRNGSLSKEQAGILEKMAPDAYASLKNIVDTVYENAPRARRPRVMQAFRITLANSDGMSVGEVMPLVGTSEQAEQQGGGLGTSRPPNANNSGIVERAKLP